MKAVAVLLIAWAPVCFGQSSTVMNDSGCGDAILLTGESYDFSSTTAGGHGGAVDWLHCASSRWSTSAGLAAYSVADTRWQVGKAGATFRYWPDLTAYASVTAGAGDSGSRGFNYFSSSEGVIVKVEDGIYLKTEHQYFDIDSLHGNLIKIGLQVQLAPAASFELIAGRSIGGNLKSEYGGGRLDVETGKGRVFVGAATGRFAPRVFDVATGVRLPDSISRQWYGGASIPLGGIDVIVAYDSQTVENVRRQTLTTALKFPFK